MKHLLTFICLLCASTAAVSQVAKREFYRQVYKENISFIAMDTIHSSQTTIVEYPDFLVAIELPFTDEGAGKSNDLKQDELSAQLFLKFLKDTYKNKPLKYIFSTHWHMHSLSAFDVFKQEGTKLVTTLLNWQYSASHGFITEDADVYASAILPVKKDTTFFAKSKFPIQVLFIDKSYDNKPTEDYLFFHFPKISTLHASCMCALFETDLSKQTKLIYSDRLSDLNRAINSRNLTLTDLIKLGRPEKINGHFVMPVFTYNYFKAYLAAGKPMKEVVRQYTAISNEVLISKQDSLLQSWSQQRFSPELLNSSVYACIKEKQYEKSVTLARLLNLYAPGVLNYIDTMGEACYAAGKIEQAQFYNDVLFRRDAGFKGGIKSWEANQKKK